MSHDSVSAHSDSQESVTIAGGPGGVHGTYVPYVKALERVATEARELARLSVRGEWEGWSQLQDQRKRTQDALDDLDRVTP